jgi:hypothetical protein
MAMGLVGSRKYARFLGGWPSFFSLPAACDSGVRPSLSSESASMSLRASSNLIIASWPAPAACDSSVRPSLSVELVLISLRARSSVTSTSFPSLAAVNNSDRPSPSSKLAAMSLWLASSFIIFSYAPSATRKGGARSLTSFNFVSLLLESVKFDRR